MSLTPAWVVALQKYGWECQHWAAVGDPLAPDATIVEWARVNDYIILTYDLDFGAILAATQASSPSVVQIRSQKPIPVHLEHVLVHALQQFETLLDTGALIVVDETRTRAVALPLRHP
jgi:predicted nuclease of predicted toxin-antitoxin system